MSVRKQIASALVFSTILVAAAIVNIAHAGAREEGRLLTATEVLEEVQGMPDQRIPDAAVRPEGLLGASRPPLNQFDSTASKIGSLRVSEGLSAGGTITPPSAELFS